MIAAVNMTCWLLRFFLIGANMCLEYSALQFIRKNIVKKKRKKKRRGRTAGATYGPSRLGGFHFSIYIDIKCCKKNMVWSQSKAVLKNRYTTLYFCCNKLRKYLSISFFSSLIWPDLLALKQSPKQSISKPVRNWKQNLAKRHYRQEVCSIKIIVCN